MESTNIDPMHRTVLNMARALPVGTISVVSLGGMDIGDLIELKRVSYLIRLNPSASRNCRVYSARQWYVNGYQTGETKYQPEEYIREYVERSQHWLVEVGMLTNLFSSGRNKSECVASFRAQSLDTGWQMREAGIKFIPPGGKNGKNARECFLLQGWGIIPHHPQFRRGIPIAVWHVVSPPYQEKSPDIIDIARRSRIACIFLVRFEALGSGAADNGAEEALGSALKLEVKGK